MKFLRHPQKKMLNATLLLGGVLCLSSWAVAQGLPDPTRPPPGFVDPSDLKAGGVAGMASAVAPPASGSGLVLQSVLLPQNGRAVAVISGQYLPLGARINEWELQSVSERDAVLIQGRERRVLKLTPQVTKTMIHPQQTADPKKLSVAKKMKKEKAKESELKR